MSKFDAEKAQWDREVDDEAARLVREGVPPHDAMKRATANVSGRRRSAGSTVVWSNQSLLDELRGGFK